MKTFKEFHQQKMLETLTGGKEFAVTFTLPDADREFAEISRYPKLKELSKEEWSNMVITGTVKKLTPADLESLGNSTASNWKTAEENFAKLNKKKRDRASVQLRAGVVEMPIVVRDGDTYDLLGGNTRLTALVKSGIQAQVLVIDISKLKEPKEEITETPIGDYETIGNWDKGASFHSKRDRMIIRHPRAIEITKKKFNNNEHTFNLYFLNSKEAKDHVELGRRGIDWVRQNLGDEVANAVEPNVGEEGHVNVIFTNNRGDQGKPMTAWMMAHRIAHSMARPEGRGNQFPSYKEAANTIAWHMSSIMEDGYGKQNYPHDDDRLNRTFLPNRDDGKVRVEQLMLKHFFTKVCTFKSARDNNLRDYFEVLNELFAQYVTTGKIKFNKAPQKFGTKGAFGSGT